MTKRKVTKTRAECCYDTNPVQMLMNLRMLLASANRLSGEHGYSEAFWAGRVYDDIDRAFTTVLEATMPDEKLRAYVREALIEHDPDIAFEDILELAMCRRAEHERADALWRGTGG